MDKKLPRALSHDEKKAAEAAYQGKPSQPTWTKTALAVYEGVLKARGIKIEAVGALESEVDSVEKPMVPEGLFEEALNLGATSQRSEGNQGSVSSAHSNLITSRQEAIDAGLLIDVSKKAQGVGFNLAVGITKSLWSKSISDSSDALDDAEATTPEDASKIRDMLLAVRLRLASVENPLPWIEVPVLFPSQQGENPAKIFPIYALFHKDPVAEECLTLIHPKDLSSIRPSSHTNAEEEQSSTDLL